MQRRAEMTRLSAFAEITNKQHRVYINTDSNDYTAGNWITVSGINSITWSSEASTVDTTDFDSDGWQANFTVTRGATLSFEGHYLVDEDTGVRDSGQAMCDVAAHQFGQGGARFLKLEAVKSTNRNAPIGHIIISANLQKGDIGGGMEDLNAFSITAPLSQNKPIGSGLYNQFS